MKEVKFLMRIDSTTQCKFGEIKKENECLLHGIITWAVKYFLELTQFYYSCSCLTYIFMI